MKKQLTLLSLCLLLVSFSYAQDLKYSFKESYIVTTPAKLLVSSHDSNLDVVSSPGNEIQVYYIVKENGKLLKIDRNELEKDFIIEVVSERNSLSITVKQRNLNSNWFKDRKNINFKILVPKQTMCELKSSDGNISMEGLDADQRCNTSDGNIYMSNITGNISGNTSDGNIDLKSIRGSVEMKTSDGNIRINEVAGDVKAGTGDGNIELLQITGNIALRTSDGDIVFNGISGAISAITSDGSIRGKVLELKNELTVKTSDGNIHVSIPANLGLDLDITGESLDVPLNNFTGKSDKKFIQGKSNGGGIAVKLTTSDGNVTLNYL